MRNEGMWRACALFAGLAMLAAGASRADAVTVVSDATWRTSAGVISVTSDWVSNLNYDDSDAAGWQFAFKSPSGHNIWHTSNMSSLSPSHARFRHIFDLPLEVASVSGTFGFDDDGDVWINGVQVVHDANGSASNSTFNLVFDPALFHPGQNLIAIEGFDKFAPFSNISGDMTINLVPEPGAAMMTLMVVGIMLGHRRRDGSACKDLL